MKKRNDIDDLLKQLEELFNNMMQGIDGPERRPVFIDISVNLYPFLFVDSDQPAKVHAGKTPVDIIETEQKMHVVIGLQGMDEETIKYSCSGSALEITASNAERTLKQTIELPSKVNKTGMKATYENGILEVIFNKSRKKIQNKSPD
jgi:HSP20 family molecular chaperone IbpA